MSVPPSKPLLLPRLVPHLFSGHRQRRKKPTTMANENESADLAHSKRSSDSDSSSHSSQRSLLDFEGKSSEILLDKIKEMKHTVDLARVNERAIKAELEAARSEIARLLQENVLYKKGILLSSIEPAGEQIHCNSAGKRVGEHVRGTPVGKKPFGLQRHLTACDL
ncbi:hypothetical protein B0H11DRAFT_2306952 [Mycena galericulata]|nr:hypothetical protein B0H11DRAFT_2306952 [Mycena galericulata]